MPHVFTFSGTIYHDLNADRIRQTNEPGLAGWRVYLDLNQDAVFESNEPSVLTNSAGLYTFTNVSTGRYVVRPVTPAHWRTINYVAWFANSKGTNTTGLDFAAAQVSEIGSRVYIDLNKNGLLDVGEPLISGWTVYIDANNNGKLDATERSFVTDGAGAFYWDGLAAGKYIIRIIQQTGYKLTSPSSYTITLATGDFQDGRNFGETLV